MTPSKLVDEDASALEVEEFQKLVNRQEGMLRDKDTVVADIKDGYDRADRRGIDKPALKDTLKWRKKGGIAAFQLHAAKVLRYLSAMGEAAQLDIFARAMTAPVFSPKTAEEKAAEAAEDEIEEIGGEEGDAMRPIGDVAAEVVETVAEMRRQDAASVEAGIDEPSQDDLVEAKLLGEADGRQGIEAGMNPWPLKDARSTWWLRGHASAYAEWQKANPTVASINAAPVKRGKGPQPGYQDKTPRMGASAAAKMLGHPASE